MSVEVSFIAKQYMDDHQLPSPIIRVERMADGDTLAIASYIPEYSRTLMISALLFGRGVHFAEYMDSQAFDRAKQGLKPIWAESKPEKFSSMGPGETRTFDHVFPPRKSDRFDAILEAEFPNPEHALRNMRGLCGQIVVRHILSDDTSM